MHVHRSSHWCQSSLPPLLLSLHAGSVDAEQLAKAFSKESQVKCHVRLEVLGDDSAGSKIRTV
jgi:hypothetical protein